MNNLDKLCDKIHKEFKTKIKTEDNLKKICEDNNICVEDYLYLQGYNDFKDYLEDLKEG